MPTTMRAQTLFEARWIFAIFAVFAIASSFLTLWLSLFFLLLLFCTLAFFRDPERAAPADPNLVVAAADGTVMDIAELESSCRSSMSTPIARQSMAGSSTDNIGTDSASMRAVLIVPRKTNQ